MKAGSDNVIVGDIPDGAVFGDRNTIYRVADANGNVILNQGGVAIGYGARADGTSIAIGSYALSSINPLPLQELLPELTALIQKAVAVGTADANKAVTEAMALRDAIQQPAPDMGALAASWKTVEMFAAACGVVDGFEKLKNFFGS